MLLFSNENHTATLHSEYPAIACVVYNDWRYLIAKIRIREENAKENLNIFERMYLKTQYKDTKNFGKERHLRRKSAKKSIKVWISNCQIISCIINT